MSDRFSEINQSKRDVPSFIEPRPPLISNPFMRPRPQKGTNLMDLFEEDSECEEPELVQVYLRLKPCSAPSNLYEVRSDRCLITSLDTATAGHGRRTQHNVSKMYTFSHIFRSETTQKEIFDHVVKDNLKKLPEGRSFTLLTYGASGSGKTYTLMGTVASPGLVPRSLEYVFKLVDVAQVPTYKPAEGGVDRLNYAEQEYELQWVKRLRKVSAPLRDKYRRMSAQLSCDLTVSQLDLSAQTRHYVWVSFIEIYNEGIYDLLAAREKGNATKLVIREDSSGNVYVKGATQAFVRSGEEAYDVMVAGKHQLQVAATGVHAQSSRSHCIFTITMITETDGACSSSCVRLCDLAGCERARRTRNTGARMQESRAINSSLHVLERCLHTLRRRHLAAAHTLVPYRESKLTRLLGAGLSGARGEAVSMVVTLNPAHEDAHETRHVLQLAAVARDIQINNTISEYPSSLESSTQDTTISFNSDIMKLRSDNERLHFELIQAQARYKELMGSMEERQAASADTMRELVEEAKEMTKQYYEAQLLALRAEMEEMAEEYENKLNELSKQSVNSTPSRDKKITQLMTENAILEEKLTAERLARVRAEEEVQHLRACIEERDEKEEELASEDVMSVTETDSETEIDDPCNESLEPTFKKEEIERSRIIRQSIMSDKQSERNGSFNSSDSNDTVLDTSDDTLKDDSNNSVDLAFTDNVLVTCKKASIRHTIDKVQENINSEPSSDMTIEKEIELQEDCEINERNNDTTNDISKELTAEQLQDLVPVKVNQKESYFFKKEENVNIEKKDLRGTYCVSTTDISDVYLDANGSDKENNDNVNKIVDEKEDIVPEIKIAKHTDTVKAESIVNKIIQRNSSKSNNSLTQFEQIELATKSCNDVNKKESKEFVNINISKEKKAFFDTDNKADYKHSAKLENRKDYFAESSKVNGNLDELKRNDDYRSPSIVKDEIIGEYEPSMIKKLLGKNLAHIDLPSAQKNTLHNSTDSVDIFESPHPTTKNLENVELIRKSIVLTDNLNVVEKSAKEVNTATEDKKQSPKEIKPPLINSNGMEEISKKIVKDNESRILKSKIANAIIKLEKASPDIFKQPLTLLKQKQLEFNQNKIDSQKDENLDQDIKPKSEPNPDLSQTITNTTVNNTLEDFENIYKDITMPRATEFDLLVSQTNEKEKESTETELKYNLRKKSQQRTRRDRKATSIEEKSDVKNDREEILLESHAKCESKRPKRNLRLRRVKNFDLEDTEQNREDKLKDIVNLQSEFSDVTMDVPAPNKAVNDIPSPEKVDENVPPMLGIQSCPAKSITRSRRKLFTPRAEPLDESLSQTGDSNERIRVPRPSYHRPRARRKL
ncbi:kinesin heavy chain-like [Zerene cesonia]|uniref:kinesin heavy chain-like n=1 Tax=Zerene cesonia TaxID=33412 RepID=UPI0018E517B8|nr:kinesin heavy chain-like [Zerene cesonia]